MTSTPLLANMMQTRNGAYMKIAIISDIHGNMEALSALTESYDELWVLGDLVNYGPGPGAVARGR